MKKFSKIFTILALVLLIVSLGYSQLSSSQKDLRAVRLQRFLDKYPYSPLRGHEHEILYCADKFGLDYRLYLAIAFAESTLGKRFPAHTKNLTGYNNCDTGFESIYDNIYSTHKLIGTTKWYKKYRETNNIKDLVYTYKGVPPYDHYIRNIRFVLNEINNISIEDVREAELKKRLAPASYIMAWNSFPFHRYDNGWNPYAEN
ncbi:MAG: hypothetical protein ABIB65_06570 [Candidatus Margulisiibacteriota bacterium]